VTRVRLRGNSHNTEPSLVPLADMLSNTVGIMLFILIFTVLATAGATVSRNFPIEHSSTKRAIFVVCAHGKLYSVDLTDLARRAYLSETQQRLDFDKLQSKIETEHVEMQGKLRQGADGRLAFAVAFTPRPEGGETTDRIATGSTAMTAMLDHNDPAKVFIYYFVTSDSIDAFLAARAVSVAKGFEYGWEPDKPDGLVGAVMFGKWPNSSTVGPE